MQAEPSPSFSRSSSRTSIDSALSSDDADGAVSSRRTRKRFTNVQLMMLENLFHHNSHPSRQERETLAKAGNMEVKSVTIWFQNRRQIERKGTTTTSTTRTGRSSPSSAPYSHTTAQAKSLTARPSLDQIASRAERPQSPRTPTRRRRDPTRPIWEAMPSSPPVPVLSPPAKDFVEFGKLKRTRTLEWACARSRLAVKSGDPVPEDDAENVPAVKQRPGLLRTWSMTSTESTVSEKENEEGQGKDNAAAAQGTAYPGVEDDMLKAALALCGLGRG
ncbi:hypothetical protein GYMLUDRAFT_254674 [Collybiopsis luxurians FD-317 M1]|nr:hypothetical protein GYMLUDRAFT_254674 [Collybiopsis luxurians FD-317 M1]